MICAAPGWPSPRRATRTTRTSRNGRVTRQPRGRCWNSAPRAGSSATPTRTSSCSGRGRWSPNGGPEVAGQTRPRPMGDILTALAAEDPARPAITCDGRTTTRAELEARANRLARSYAELGVGHKDFVTVALPNGIEFYEACYAIWKLGAVPQPASARLPSPELGRLLALADPALVVGVAAG